MKIKVAIVGVGNCASSFLQGLTYYQKIKADMQVTGLMNSFLGGYSISDIEVVAAFDVNQTKVGKDLAEAIYAYPNNTKVFAQVKNTGVVVQNAPLFDSIGKYLKNVIKPSSKKLGNIKEILKRSGACILVNFLPVGSQKATEYWADLCLATKIAFINCIPVFIASNSVWAEKFRQKHIPLIGDDIKSQMGATIIHRALVNLFLDRGMPIDKTYQLNIGGNTDFLNMLERERLASKKISKTRSVTSQINLHDKEILDQNVHIGPSDYISWLQDNKVAYIRIESRHFGDVPMNLELRLSVEDSPNSAGVVIDAIRCCQLALNNDVGGVLIEPSAYFMKSPTKQFTDSQAKKNLEKFIKRYSTMR